MTCRECERRRETFSARRKGGGTYRRAPRIYSAQICLECANHLVSTATPGHSLNNNWEVSDLSYIISLKEGS